MSINATNQTLYRGPVDNSVPTQIATTGYIATTISTKANIDSPAFTGTPTAPTPLAGDNDTSIATTAFVQNAISGIPIPTGVALLAAGVPGALQVFTGYNRFANAVNIGTSALYTGIRTDAINSVISNNNYDGTNYGTTYFQNSDYAGIHNVMQINKDGVYITYAGLTCTTGNIALQYGYSSYYSDTTNAYNSLIQQQGVNFIIKNNTGGGSIYLQSDTGARICHFNANGMVLDTGTLLLPTAGAYPQANSDNVPTYTYVNSGLNIKANLDSPVFTGNPTAPTPLSSDNDTTIATTAFVQSVITPKANLDSPVFTGNPTAPTPIAGDNDTSIATTAFVVNAVNVAKQLVISDFAFDGVITDILGAATNVFSYVSQAPIYQTSFSNGGIIQFVGSQVLFTLNSTPAVDTFYGFVLSAIPYPSYPTPAVSLPVLDTTTGIVYNLAITFSSFTANRPYNMGISWKTSAYPALATAIGHTFAFNLASCPAFTG
jgi:hypothetical protein